MNLLQKNALGLVGRHARRNFIDRPILQLKPCLATLADQVCRRGAKHARTTWCSLIIHGAVAVQVHELSAHQIIVMPSTARVGVRGDASDDDKGKHSARANAVMMHDRTPTMWADVSTLNQGIGSPGSDFSSFFLNSATDD